MQNCLAVITRVHHTVFVVWVNHPHQTGHGWLHWCTRRTASGDMAVDSDCTAGRINSDVFFLWRHWQNRRPIHWRQFLTGGSFKNFSVLVLARPRHKNYLKARHFSRVNVIEAEDTIMHSKKTGNVLNSDDAAMEWTGHVAGAIQQRSTPRYVAAIRDKAWRGIIYWWQKSSRISSRQNAPDIRSYTRRLQVTLSATEVPPYNLHNGRIFQARSNQLECSATAATPAK